MEQIISEKSRACGADNIFLSQTAITKFAEIVGIVYPVKKYQYKFDFGQYLNKDYFSNSYIKRPITYINKYRKKHKVRELDYQKVKKEMING